MLVGFDSHPRKQYCLTSFSPELSSKSGRVIVSNKQVIEVRSSNFCRIVVSDLHRLQVHDLLTFRVSLLDPDHQQ